MTKKLFLVVLVVAGSVFLFQGLQGLKSMDDPFAEGFKILKEVGVTKNGMTYAAKVSDKGVIAMIASDNTLKKENISFTLSDMDDNIAILSCLNGKCLWAILKGKDNEAKTEYLSRDEAIKKATGFMKGWNHKEMKLQERELYEKGTRNSL
jgi:hypothetical protein